MKEKVNYDFAGKVQLVLLVFMVVFFTFGCSTADEPNTSLQETTEAENLTTESTSETQEATEAQYVPAIPGVPEELKGSEYDLAKALTETSLRDVFHKYFSVGVGINGQNTTNAMVESPELRAIAKYHFNSMTYTNLMKPAYLLSFNGCVENAENGDNTTVAVNFESCIPGLDFAKENNMGIRGHVLVWHTQVPDWFFREDYEVSKDFVDKETMLARMESYIKQVLEFTQTEYPGVVYAWDVVNEAVEISDGMFDETTGWNTRTHYGDMQENLWYTVIGSEYVEKAFEYARKYAAPDVKLFYNDYNTFEFLKTLAICNLVESLKEKGLIDGIGMQSTFGLTYPSSLTNGVNSIREALERFSKLDVEIHMSEVTIRIEDENDFEAQAQRYREFFDLILSMHKLNGGPANITNVTFFGIMDRYLLYGNNQECHWLFDDKLQPKPSFYSVLDAVRAVEDK